MPKRTDISKVLAVGVMLLALESASAQGKPAGEDKVEPHNALPRICGRLGYNHGEKPKGVFVKWNFEAIGKARLRLFRREAGVECCGAAALVKETVSGRDGSFKFKVKDGRYWLVAEVAGHEFRLPVRQDKKADLDDVVCWNNSFAIGDDGKFELIHIAVLD
jgi:hypothetical protein